MGNIYYQEGPMAFWNGNGANTLKIMPESAVRFLGYEVFKNGVCKVRCCRVCVCTRVLCTVSGT